MSNSVPVSEQPTLNNIRQFNPFMLQNIPISQQDQEVFNQFMVFKQMLALNPQLMTMISNQNSPMTSSITNGAANITPLSIGGSAIQNSSNDMQLSTPMETNPKNPINGHVELEIFDDQNNVTNRVAKDKNLVRHDPTKPFSIIKDSMRFISSFKVGKNTNIRSVCLDNTYLWGFHMKSYADYPDYLKADVFDSDGNFICDADVLGIYIRMDNAKDCFLNCQCVRDAYKTRTFAYGTESPEGPKDRNVNLVMCSTAGCVSASCSKCSSGTYTCSLLCGRLQIDPIISTKGRNRPLAASISNRSYLRCTAIMEDGNRCTTDTNSTDSSGNIFKRANFRRLMVDDNCSIGCWPHVCEYRNYGTREKKQDKSSEEESEEQNLSVDPNSTKSTRKTKAIKRSRTFITPENVANENQIIHATGIIQHKEDGESEFKKPRGRGRPPGSKNKKKSVATSTNTTSNKIGRTPVHEKAHTGITIYEEIDKSNKQKLNFRKYDIEDLENDSFGLDTLSEAASTPRASFSNNPTPSINSPINFTPQTISNSIDNLYNQNIIQTNNQHLSLSTQESSMLIQNTIGANGGFGLMSPNCENNTILKVVNDLPIQPRSIELEDLLKSPSYITSDELEARSSSGFIQTLPATPSSTLLFGNNTNILTPSTPFYSEVYPSTPDVIRNYSY